MYGMPVVYIKVINRFLLARCLSCGMRRIGRNDFYHKEANANFTVNYQLGVISNKERSILSPTLREIRTHI
jgi:hypothetical protein